MCHNYNNTRDIGSHSDCVFLYLQISLKATQNVWWRKWCRGLRGWEAPGQESQEGKDRVFSQVERSAQTLESSSHDTVLMMECYRIRGRVREYLGARGESRLRGQDHGVWEEVQGETQSAHHFVIISFSYSFMFSYSPPPGERRSRKGRSLYHILLP